MIKINNTEYQKYETKITWGKYEIYKNKIRKTALPHSLTLISKTRYLSV